MLQASSFGLKEFEFQLEARPVFVDAGAGAAAAAAAAAERARCEEEEEMADYDPRDLDPRDIDGAWEFKILRSRTGSFKKPETLRRVLDEEAAAGWELVEKFDDNRLRLKRRTEHRQNDDLLGFDAYRTYVGLLDGQTVMIVAVIAACCLLAFGLLLSLAAAFG